MQDKTNNCSACLTFDFDSFSVWLHGFQVNSPTHMSKGEFGGRVGVPRILDLLRNYGITATFFVPGHTIDSWPGLVEQIAGEGDVPHDDKGFEWGTETELVEVPVSWSLDDFPYFEFLFQPMYLRGLAAPSWVLEMWAEDFDYMYSHVPGGVFNATFHPQVIGRGARMNMLENLINHIRGHAGAEFKTVRQVVAEFKAHNRPNEAHAEPRERAAE